VGTKNEHGSYYIPHPLDFAILELLKPEGSMLGYHVLALPASAITKTLNKNVPKEYQLKGSSVSGRIVAMNHEGFVSKHPLLGQGGRHGWQRTPKGTKHYQEHTGKRLDPPAGELTIVEGGQE
jgi:hypothetical protein